jgi:hypothetical protein
MCIRRHRSNDARLGASPQRVPQQAGELAVSVRDVAQVLHQCCDYSAQRQQALVDQPSFLSTSLRSNEETCYEMEHDITMPEQVDQEQGSVTLAREGVFERLFTKTMIPASERFLAIALTSARLAPEREMFSDPAKSTKFSFPHLISSSPSGVDSLMWMVMAKTECDRLHQ